MLLLELALAWSFKCKFVSVVVPLCSVECCGGGRTSCRAPSIGSSPRRATSASENLANWIDGSRSGGDEIEGRLALVLAVFALVATVDVLLPCNSALLGSSTAVASLLLDAVFVATSTWFDCSLCVGGGARRSLDTSATGIASLVFELPSGAEAGTV